MRGLQKKKFRAEVDELPEVWVSVSSNCLVPGHLPTVQSDNREA
jgi:hypothetical protein